MDEEEKTKAAGSVVRTCMMTMRHTNHLVLFVLDLIPRAQSFS